MFRDSMDVFHQQLFLHAEAEWLPRGKFSFRTELANESARKILGLANARDRIREEATKVEAEQYKGASGVCKQDCTKHAGSSSIGVMKS